MQSATCTDCSDNIILCRGAGSYVKMVLQKFVSLKMIARSAKKFLPFVSKTGVATATAVQYLMGSCLPHQHYTNWYDGR